MPEKGQEQVPAGRQQRDLSRQEQGEEIITYSAPFEAIW
jgi:hypothetical protein